MLLVIFGAGASYDSIHPSDLQIGVLGRSTRTGGWVELKDWGHPARPPLARDLVELRPQFGAALKKYPECRSLVMMLRRILERSKSAFDIEKELERVHLLSKDEPHRLKQLMAFRFYLREILTAVPDAWLEQSSGATNYVALLERIESWRERSNQRVALVTFNYDTLLDQALETVGIDIGGMHDYVRREEYVLLKPHGSVDWGRYISAPHIAAVEASEAERDLIRSAGHVELSSEYVWLGRTADVRRDNRMIVPAIAIPTLGKSDFECPPNHLEVVKGLLSEVTRVLVVGWRGSEKHFVDELLRGGLKNPISVIAIANGGVSDSRMAADILASSTELPSDRFAATELGFSSLVEGNPEAEEILGQVLKIDR